MSVVSVMNVLFPAAAVLLTLNAAFLVALVLVQKGRALQSIFGTGHDVIGPHRAPTVLFWLTTASFGSLLVLAVALNLLAR